MNLTQALRLDRLLPDQPIRLAITGAGGKTSLMYHLAWELTDTIQSTESRSTESYQTVILTTTTHLAGHQVWLANQHHIVSSYSQIRQVFDNLQPGVAVLTGPIKEDRYGSPEVNLDEIADEAARRSFPLIIEADGARQRPLKAPADHEPVIPIWINRVIVVAGLEGLGHPLNAEWVHRPERFSQLAGIPPGATIDFRALTRVLTHPEGGLKAIPSSAVHRTVCLSITGGVNNTEPDPVLSSRAASMKSGLLARHSPSEAGGNIEVSYDAVITVSLPNINRMTKTHELPAQVYAVYERVAGIVLAAGPSSRFSGSSSTPVKQLLPWRGEPFVRQVSKTALAAGLDPVVVVTGACSDEVASAVEGLPVLVKYNPEWSTGQGSSVAAGINALPRGIGAAIYLLADQPQVPVSLLQSLIETHDQALPAILAPQVDGRRANPVLFDRITFDELRYLTGERGGRALFSRYPVSWLPWFDEGLLLDVDSPDDYQRLLRMEE